MSAALASSNFNQMMNSIKMLPIYTKLNVDQELSLSAIFFSLTMVKGVV
jgi:hypothetical protein